MSIFGDKTISWDGKTYTIPARQVLEAIARVEEFVTLPELLSFSARGTIPTSRLARAYGALLRFAGAELEDEDVYKGMFGALVGSPEHSSAIVLACAGLIQLLVPKAKTPVRAIGEAPEVGNSPAGEKPDNSPSPGLKSRSAPGGARRSSSGNSRRKSST